VGYGLPIGGVLATKNAIIPYAVGVDIACRMMLSVFPESPALYESQFDRLKKALENETHFGIGNVWKARHRNRPQHAILDAPLWKEIPMLKSLQAKAQAQIGTSGSGNHFVEWGIFTLINDEFGLKAEKYMALLSHSGSRGVGATIAEHFTRIAKAKHAYLPPSAQNLAWLNMDSEDGIAYWNAMQLAGEFAQANHHIIHRRVADYAGLSPIFQVENHHNFAWKEVHNSEEVIVHRKGATPAGKGVLGIIPGSMADEGYLVRGLGEATSLASASHGAGRQMSRKKANDSITKSLRDEYLKEKGITLLSAGLDESPQAYKPIQEVIKAQMDLVEVLGKFEPKIVKMA
jgi:tRNA-splicing ligase RtcB (3'-phosphate/5'-hydroxy nucleic acid ligase)